MTAARSRVRPLLLDQGVRVGGGLREAAGRLVNE